MPKNWFKVKLEDVADNSAYPIGDGDHGQIKPAMYTTQGVPYIRVSDMNWGGLDLKNVVYISKKVHAENIKSHLKPGDVLIAKTGATIGKCCIIPDFVEEANTTSSVGKISLNKQLMLPKWLLYFFLTREFKDFMWSISERTAQPGFNNRDIKLFEVPLPPMSEQQRIIAKLDELMEKLDRSRARLERIPKILKRFRQSILFAAVSGKLTEEWRDKNTHHNGVAISSEYKISEDYRELTELPSNWKWVAIGNYVKCNRGRFSVRPRNDPRYFGGGIPFIQIGDLPREGGFVNKHTQTLNQDGLKVSKMFPKNTVAIAIVGATIGNTGILNYDMCFTDSMVGINTGELQLNLFIDYYLRNEKENLRQLSYAGGGQPNIKLELLNAYPFPLPPLEEQREIVRRIGKLFTVTDKFEARYHIAKAQVDKLPQSLLAKAFRGELVGQDENDEPATVLLERSKAAKSMDPRLSRGTKEF